MPTTGGSRDSILCSHFMRISDFFTPFRACKNKQIYGFRFRVDFKSNCKTIIRSVMLTRPFNLQTRKKSNTVFNSYYYGNKYLLKDISFYERS